jgi:hypothetical protein
MYVFPTSHLEVHAAFEPGRAGEKSVFADYFCSRRHPFFSSCMALPMSTQDLLGSVARGSQFLLRNIKGLVKIFNGLQKSGDEILKDLLKKNRKGATLFGV